MLRTRPRLARRRRVWNFGEFWRVSLQCTQHRLAEITKLQKKYGNTFLNGRIGECTGAFHLIIVEDAKMGNGTVALVSMPPNEFPNAPTPTIGILGIAMANGTSRTNGARKDGCAIPVEGRLSLGVRDQRIDGWCNRSTVVHPTPQVLGNWQRRRPLERDGVVGG